MPTPFTKSALAAMPTVATMTDAGGSTWHLKVNDKRGQLWLSEDGTRVKVYHWTGEGPRFVREE